MLGSAVSSSTPKDFQPSPHMGLLGSCPLMNRQAAPGPAVGCPYPAVGMQRALASAIGLPRRSTSALWMLGFLMPAEVSRNFMMALLILYQLSITFLEFCPVLCLLPIHQLTCLNSEHFALIYLQF